MTRRRALAWLWLASLGAGLFVLVYRGPGRPLIRGHGGDVAITAFLFFTLALLTPWRPRTRLALVGLLAAATEAFQALGPALSGSTLVDLTVGRTFDWLDLLAYALGLALAALAERRLAPADAA